MSIENPQNPSNYQMPKPTRFLILDDLSSTDANAQILLKELCSLTDSRDKAILVSTSKLAKRLRREYEKSLRNPDKPIELGFTIGNAGDKVARKLDLKIPLIKLSPTRINMENGDIRIISKESDSLLLEITDEVKKVPNNLKQIGIIDDTIFSGETLKAVIKELKNFFPDQGIIALALTYLPHLASSQLDFKNLKIIAGLTLRSAIEKQVGINSIDARDFIDENALPLSNGLSIPFMQEENWMRVWFGNNYEKAMKICVELKRL